MIYREKIVGVRLTEEEYERICKRAKGTSAMQYKNGKINVSGYIRKCALQGGVSNDSSQQKTQNNVKNLTYQIRKIGVNVNQATKKINSGYGMGKATEAIREELIRLNDLFDAFLQIMQEQEQSNGRNKIDEY